MTNLRLCKVAKGLSEGNAVEDIVACDFKCSKEAYKPRLVTYILNISYPQALTRKNVSNTGYIE